MSGNEPNGEGWNDVTKTVVRSTPDRPPGNVGIAGVDKPTPVVVQAMPVWLMVLVRVVRVYLQSFLGLLGANSVGAIDISEIDAFGQQWGTLATVMMTALAPAFVALCMNALEFLNNIDTHAPKLRG